MHDNIFMDRARLQCYTPIISAIQQYYERLRRDHRLGSLIMLIYHLQRHAWLFILIGIVHVHIARSGSNSTWGLMLSVWRYVCSFIFLFNLITNTTPLSSPLKLIILLSPPSPTLLFNRRHHLLIRQIHSPSASTVIQSDGITRLLCFDHLHHRVLLRYYTTEASNQPKFVFGGDSFIYSKSSRLSATST